MKENGKGGEYRRSRRKHPKRKGDEPQLQTQTGSENFSGGSAKAKSKNRNKNRVKSKKSALAQLISDGKLAKKPPANVPRLKWIPPEAPEVKLEPAACVWCEKPIGDFSTAVTDPASGQAGHFDCAVNRLRERESLETGDTVGYIGAGRFGVITFEKAGSPKTFRIKKVLQWENTETRSAWRNALSEHFSVT